MTKFHQAHTTSTVLVIEPDALMLTAIGGVLDMHGHKAILARTEAVALQALDSGTIDLIVMAIENLEQGTQMAERLRSNPDKQEIPVIFIVPEMAIHWSTTLQLYGGVFCVLRSVGPHALIDLVDKALWMPHLANRRTAPPAPHTNTAQDWIRLEE